MWHHPERHQYRREWLLQRRRRDHQRRRGTYTENDTIAASSLNSLTVVGAGASTTTVNGNEVNTVFTVSNGIVTISGLTVTGGGTGQFYSSVVGGIRNDGTLTISNSTVSGNQSGILNDGTLTVSDSTVSGNSTVGDGGGINNGGTLTVSNSTLSGNSAYGEGGGIDNGGTATISASTLVGNHARLGGGGIDGTATISASIVADNNVSEFGQGPNCDGYVINEGYNIDDDSPPGPHVVACGFSSSTTIDASLSTLGNHGGPTQTILPLAGSPVLGVIPPGTTLNGMSVCPWIDQRGVASAPGANCTIGAVEVDVCTTGLTSHVLTATYPSGAFTGVFCLNAKGVGSYTQGPVSGIGGLRTVNGTTYIGALGKNLLLAGAMNATKNGFVELAPVPAIGTFTLF